MIKMSIITDNGNSAMTAPAALEILNDVFGYPSFRGRQAEIVETLAGGNSLLVLKIGRAHV